jgi:hypothetical protein
MSRFNMTQNRDIAAALGRELWSTDAFVPQYRSGEIGPWRINTGGQLVNDWGYYSGPCLLEMLPSLARRVPSKTNVDGDGWETWMSLTPLEIESQELGFLQASENVVIMGLGMGWVAANSALNPKVTQVTVVERDPDVIRLFHDSGVCESLPRTAQQKIAIVNADALEWQPDSGITVNFLYADIWLHLAEPNAMRQVRRMQDNIQADAIYFWGQELAIYSAIQRDCQETVVVTENAIRRAVTDVIGLPLLIPHDRNYARMIEQVVRNRIGRRLPVEMNIG